MSPSTPARPRSHVWRKLLAVLLVITALTGGLVGVVLATSGQPWGWLLLVATPFGIWAAMRVTPGGGTTGYFDKNI